MTQEHPEVEPAKRAPHETARTLTLDLGLRGLDQPSIRHAGGTDGLTRAAIEAERQMLGDRVGQRDTALGERLDQEDPAARRVHLCAELGKRRTIRETEAAVNALVHAIDAQPVKAERRGRGRVLGRRVGHRVQIPATKRPGFRTLWGSRLALSRCMIRPAAPASSHTGTADFTASGAQSRVAWPPNCAAMRPSSLHCHSTCSRTPSKPTTRVYRPGPSAD